MNKIKTTEAKIFLCEYYNKKNIITELKDWDLQKKYKNLQQNTCRDFLNQKNNIMAVIIEDNEKRISILEDKNFDSLIKEMEYNKLFYYVPTICNDGLVFVFKPINYIGNQWILEKNRYKEILEKKLFSLFSKNDLFSINSDLNFAFPNMEMDIVIAILEKNQMEFNDKAFTDLPQKIFQILIPDMVSNLYDFKEYKDLNEENSINLVLEIISKNNFLQIEDYAKIKFLIKKLSRNEFETIRKIALSFSNNKDMKLTYIFDVETNRKKAQELVKDIWSKRYKV